MQTKVICYHADAQNMSKVISDKRNFGMLLFVCGVIELCLMLCCFSLWLFSVK